MLRIEVDGVKYELVMPDDMTMREQRDFEKIAEIGIDAIGRLEDEWRAGVVLAWMAVSIKRAKPAERMNEIVARLDDFKAADLKAAWAEITEQRPPETADPLETTTAGEETLSAGYSADDSEPTPERESPNGSGLRGSDAGSVSDPATLET